MSDNLAMRYGLAALNSEYDYENNTVTIPISALARVGSRDFHIGDFRDLVNSLRMPLPDISRVYFNEPYTIVVWADRTKTVVKCSEEDAYHRHTGLAMCALKKVLGDEEYSEWKRTVNLVFDPRRLEVSKAGDIWTYTYRAK